MNLFAHDGSMDGMLQAAAQALAKDGEPVFRSPEAQNDLFGGGSPPESDAARDAARLIRRIDEELGADWVRRTLRLLCAEEPDAVRALFRLLRLAFEKGPDVIAYHAHPDVRRAHAIDRPVGIEAHRLKGLLRFRRLATGRWWAPMEPVHNVLALIAPHFARRLAPEPWVIHDVPRGLAIGAEGGAPPTAWPRERIREEVGHGLDASEAAYQTLWRTFYDAIAVRSRTNPGLQRRNMPARYWKYLVETPQRLPRAAFPV